MLKKPKRSLLSVAILSLLLALGCVTARIPKEGAAYIHVAANGVTTFMGEPLGVDHLAKQLKRAGATQDTLIKLIPQGEVPELILHSIAGALGRGGLPRVVIVEPRKAVTIVDGQTTERHFNSETGESSDRTLQPLQTTPAAKKRRAARSR